MKEILVADDELKRLERRFGPGVRRMGPWSSDGTFGYASVSIAVVTGRTRNPEFAARQLAPPSVLLKIPAPAVPA
jgi:hypothetical protein